MTMQSARAAIGVLAVLACTCTVLPAAAQENATPAAPAQQNAAPGMPDTAMATGGGTGAERWALDRCIATALRQNGDAKAAHARTIQARGGALRAWGGILPSISTDFNYTYSDTRPDTVGALVGGGSSADLTLKSTIKNRSFGANASMNLLSIPAWSEKKRAGLLRGSAEEGEAEARNTVVFRVKQQYFGLIKAVRLAQVSRESEKLAKDEEARSEALFQVGTVARGDVLKARARRAQTQLDRIRAENQVEIQRSMLKQVIGVSPGTPIEIEEVMTEDVALPDSLDSIRRSLQSRPGLSQWVAAERAARAGLFGARTQRLPSVAGSVGVSRNRFNQRVEVPGSTIDDTSKSTRWQASVGVTLPIFDGLVLEGGMKSARGQLLEAEANRRQYELNVSVEVQTAWLALREAAERISVAKEGLASAEEDYKFSKGRYDLGAGTFLDLLTAEVSLSNAKRSYVEALADARVAEADLERAIGEKRY